jgi:hypothetical protein
MEFERGCCFDCHQNVIMFNAAGTYDLATVQAVMSRLVFVQKKISARGFIVDLSDATLALDDSDYDLLGVFREAQYKGELVPASIVSRHSLADAERYAQHAVEAGWPVRACLTQVEALAWIDLCTAGNRSSPRLEKLLRLHEVISFLGEMEIDEVLQALEAHVAPRQYSCAEILGSPSRDRCPLARLLED